MPLVEPVDKPDGKKTPFGSSAAPATTFSSSRHDTNAAREHALALAVEGGLAHEIGRGFYTKTRPYNVNTSER